MKCYCRETEAEFIFCVEDVENARLEDVIRHTGFTKSEGMFSMSSPRHEIPNPYDRQLVGENFARLGQAMFESLSSGFDWRKPLELLAQRFTENEIEWYIVGSVGDAVRGVDVKPFDMDIVVHTRDFNRAKDICYLNFPDSVISHFSDDQKLCPLRCFGRLFLAGAMVEIAADEQWNLECRQPQYEKVSWRGYDLYLDSFQLRYQIEVARDRGDRIRAMEEFMKRQKT